MNQNDFINVNNSIKVLIGTQGLSFGRAAAMAWVWFNFGSSAYALHIQSCFRIRDSEEILVTNTDMFEPSELALSNTEYDPETFDWDIQGENQYDEWVRKLDPNFLSNLRVIDVNVNKYGDLTIQLNHNIAIDVFVNFTTDECWRFFKTETDEHLVISGNGLESE